MIVIRHDLTRIEKFEERMKKEEEVFESVPEKRLPRMMRMTTSAEMMTKVADGA
jgi:hypothetical protein